MLVGTYGAALLVVAASLAIGQAAITLCGPAHRSWLAPPVGLALVCALCWGTVRLPGDGALSAALVAAFTIAAAVVLRGRLEIGRGDLALGAAVAAAALVAASLPFIAEGHIGILGTGFNPDMSQHLLTADRLSGGHGGELIRQGYPLGPHSVVVALNRGVGIDLVQGFAGLTIAVAVLAPLTALAAFDSETPILRGAAALVIGFAYLVASYFAQGAFKETMQALFVLAFALSLREVARNPDWRDAPLRYLPSALIAAGSAYVYSYPGLAWMAATAVVWLAIERLMSRKWPATGRDFLRAAGLAALTFLVLVAPEIGRMVEFHNFETFDPNGPGLGNLFNPISPFEALGIWPSGDFRLEPGAGAAPAMAYYLGAGYGLVLLAYGVLHCWAKREYVALSGLAAVVVVYLVAWRGGTPYTEAKALVIAAPIAALVILVPLARRPIGWLYMLAAGGCSLLALANAPVGPTSYSPELTGLRPLVKDGSTLFLGSDRLLDEEHGDRYVVWELRGGRVCVAPDSEAGGRAPRGVSFVVTEGADEPPFRGLRLERRAGPYELWRGSGPVRPGPCPLIAVRQARAGSPQ
jgi:hypothetical protein